MTFEHQTQMTNFITRVAWEACMGQSIDADLEAMVTYMLLADEVPLKEPVQGVSTFTKTFPERGPPAIVRAAPFAISIFRSACSAIHSAT